MDGDLLEARSVSGGRGHGESINAHEVVHVREAGHVDTSSGG